MKKQIAIVIAEKPTAAKRIAESFLPESKVNTIKNGDLIYYEVEFPDKIYRVIPALGHLYTLKQVKKSWTYPTFETYWIPSYEVKKGPLSSKIKKTIELFKELSKDADYFISACDYDIEGSLIAYLILKEALGDSAVEKARRAKFSTLTKKDLQNAFANLSPKLDFNLIEAGLTRHEVDWLFGINLTRALTLAIKNSSGNFKILSTGRVQGPTLSFVVKREIELNTFIPTPFWVIDAAIEIDGKKYPIEYYKSRIMSEVEAKEIVDICKGQNLELIDTKTSTKKISRPTPFNLTKLQTEAYRFFGFTPSRTLRIAENLYLAALISYPRTSSEKLPPSIDVKGIVNELAKQSKYKKLALKLINESDLIPNNGKKEDPAHPAIHPTGQKPERDLNSAEKKIYDLIVKNFLATLATDALSKVYKNVFKYLDHIFYLKGKFIVKMGWIPFYEPYYKIDEIRLPDLKIGDKFVLSKIDYIEKFTSPPPRYNPSSLLKIMEKNNLGTKATRAGIIETLYKRGYIRNNRIEITPLAWSVVEVLSKYCPEILSPELTRNLENKMDLVEKGSESRESVLKETKTFLTIVLEKIKSNEAKIGASLNSALDLFYKLQRDLGKCPNCEDGRLILVKSKKTGKRFVACTNYFKEKNRCNTSLPVSQKGSIMSTGKVCKYCNFPIVKIAIPGKRPFQGCVNWINCESYKAKKKKK